MDTIYEIFKDIFKELKSKSNQATPRNSRELKGDVKKYDSKDSKRLQKHLKDSKGFHKDFKNFQKFP